MRLSVDGTSVTFTAIGALRKQMVRLPKCIISFDGECFNIENSAVFAVGIVQKFFKELHGAELTAPCKITIERGTFAIFVRPTSACCEQAIRASEDQARVIEQCMLRALRATKTEYERRRLQQ